MSLLAQSCTDQVVQLSDLEVTAFSVVSWKRESHAAPQNLGRHETVGLGESET